MEALIENHKKSAKHLEEAAKNHHDAAIHHEQKHHEKAHLNTIEVHAHTKLATEAHEGILKHHALTK